MSIITMIFGVIEFILVIILFIAIMIFFVFYFLGAQTRSNGNQYASTYGFDFWKNLKGNKTDNKKIAEEELNIDIINVMIKKIGLIIILIAINTIALFVISIINENIK